MKYDAKANHNHGAWKFESEQEIADIIAEAVAKYPTKNNEAVKAQMYALYTHGDWSKYEMCDRNEFRELVESLAKSVQKYTA